MDPNCNNCAHAPPVLLEDTITHGKEYTKTIECELDYEIVLGGQPGCGGKYFEPRE